MLIGVIMSEQDSSRILDGVPYSQEERGIYRYKVAGSDRVADPIALMRRVHKAQRDLGINLENAQKNVRVLSEAGDEVQLGPDMMAGYYEALGEIAAVALAAFGLKSIEDDEEAGVTESEALDLLYAFFRWMNGTREDFPNTPSSPTSTESDPTDSGDPTAAASPTGPSLDSGPTSPASATSGRRRRSSG